MITKIMKYEIKYNKELYNILDDIRYIAFKIKNRSVQMAWDWQQFSFGYKNRVGNYPKEKEMLGKTLSSDIYNNVKAMGEDIATTIINSCVKEGVSRFKNDKKDILNGNVTIPSFKREGSFPLRAQGIKKLEKINFKTYQVNLSLLSRAGANKLETKTSQRVTLKTGNGANTILDRIISGEYKMSDSLIKKNKNKYFLYLAYSFEPEKVKTLDKEKIMGIDMGIVYPVYMAFNDSLRRYNIEGGEINHFRRGIDKRRKQLFRQGKYSGRGRRGHGTKTKIKPIQKLTDKVENFKNTTNHKYSKYVIDMAIKHDCGVIQMEDLSGIADGEKKSSFLGDWTYYDLQRKIEYKAEEKGIEVVKVKPNYTSQRCSKCGVIHKGNRNAKEDQSKFECVTCGFKTNADYNAAKNIATKDIDWIIEEQLKFQESRSYNDFVI